MSFLVLIPHPSKKSVWAAYPDATLTSLNHTQSMCPWGEQAVALLYFEFYIFFHIETSPFGRQCASWAAQPPRLAKHTTVLENTTP